VLLFSGIVTRTPPPSRSNHLCVNGKAKCEHPSKKSAVTSSIYSKYEENEIYLRRIFLFFLIISANPPRNIDLQLPGVGSTSRRSSYGSDTESRFPSGKTEFSF
jgi:hypothetical protein